MIQIRHKAVFGLHRPNSLKSVSRKMLRSVLDQLAHNMLKYAAYRPVYRRDKTGKQQVPLAAAL
jgi:hypothetical protein